MSNIFKNQIQKPFSSSISNTSQFPSYTQTSGSNIFSNKAGAMQSSAETGMAIEKEASINKPNLGMRGVWSHPSNIQPIKQSGKSIFASDAIHIQDIQPPSKPFSVTLPKMTTQQQEMKHTPNIFQQQQQSQGAGNIFTQGTKPGSTGLSPTPFNPSNIFGSQNLLFNQEVINSDVNMIDNDDEMECESKSQFSNQDMAINNQLFANNNFSVENVNNYKSNQSIKPSTTLSTPLSIPSTNSINRNLIPTKEPKTLEEFEDIVRNMFEIPRII